MQKGMPEIVLKGELQVALKLHLFMILSKHKSVHNDSIKWEIEVTLNVALDSTFEISF